MKDLKALLILLSLLAAVTFSVEGHKLPKPAIPLPTFKPDTFDIRKSGAVDRPGVLNTDAIQHAIDECNRQGGGVVLVPPGVWLSGPLVLKSNVNLHLRRNAMLYFSRDFANYPLVETGWEGLRQMRMHSPIRAERQQNIAITGQGVIDGNGDAFRFAKRSKLTESQWNRLVASGGVVTPDGKEWYPSASAMRGRDIPDAGALSPEKDAAFFEKIKDFLRPDLVVLERCERILLEGVTFQNSGAWNIHPLMSNDITVRNIIVRNPWYSQNGDGLDIESCKNVLVEDSFFDVGDDAICVKSGKNEYGRKMGMPTENLWVRNCVVYHAHGGFVVGSEMSGGARNLYVSDCTFIGTDIGLRFKTQRGRGGVVENVYISDIYMKDIPGEAILFDMYYQVKDPVTLAGETREPPVMRPEPVTDGTPQFRKFWISNIVCDGAAKGIFIRGLPEMSFNDITIADFDARADEGIDLQESSNIVLRNIRLDIPPGKPIAYLYNTERVTVDGLDYNKGAPVLVHVQGEKSNAIRIANTDTKKADKAFVANAGAKARSVTID